MLSRSTLGEDRVETFEIEQQLGDNVVRGVCMGSTDGLRRGMTAVSDGEPITVPVGPETLGRLFNVTGEPIDGKGDVTTGESLSDSSPPALVRRAKHTS